MSIKISKQLWTSTFPGMLGFAGALILLGTVANSSSCLAADTAVAPLRVAIAPEYPPLVFRQPDGTNGVEIDLAKALGKELKRPVKFVVMRFDQLIPALVDNEADIIMSGMSITKARQLRIAFSEPYLHNQLRAIFRLKDASQYKSADDILKSTAKIGVVPGTTADVFVSKNCPNAQKATFVNRQDVPVLLIRGDRLDVFVDDTFALAPMVAAHEAEIAYLREPLNEEDLAWGVRQSDAELLAAANSALAKWKIDGTLEKTLDRWIPYLKNIKSQ